MIHWMGILYCMNVFWKKSPSGKPPFRQQKIQNDHNLLIFYLSESCKRLNKDLMISIFKLVLVYDIKWFAWWKVFLSFFWTPFTICCLLSAAHFQLPTFYCFLLPFIYYLLFAASYQLPMFASCYLQHTISCLLSAT